jgi:hypothetical protein
MESVQPARATRAAQCPKQIDRTKTAIYVHSAASFS